MSDASKSTKSGIDVARVWIQLYALAAVVVGGAALSFAVQAGVLEPAPVDISTRIAFAGGAIVLGFGLILLSFGLDKWLGHLVLVPVVVLLIWIIGPVLMVVGIIWGALNILLL